jgi:hypothetical protein
MTDGLFVTLVCAGLLIILLPSFIIMAMVSRIRYMVGRLEKSVALLRKAEEERIRDDGCNQQHPQTQGR